MDIHEKTPRPEGRPEGQSEGSKPRDGRRGGRYNHHHRGGKNNRPKNPEGAEQNTPVAGGETPSPETRDRDAGRQNDRRNQNDRGQQNRNKGNRPDRDGAKADTPKAEAPKQEPREQTAPKSGEGNARRQPPATGRPQRNIHRGPAHTDLPDMDNLLIEDNAAARTAPAVPEDAPDAAELERILERDIFEPAREAIPEVLPEGKVVVAGIRFRPGGKTYFFDPGEHTCVAGKYAIVETPRGLEFGEICMGNRMVDLSTVVLPLRPVVRVATEADIAHNKENRDREESAFRIGIQKIREHKLDMKLVSVQYTFDDSKLLFYFTSDGRVDFRELVKDLAGVFHIRIELRQIGIRDDARMLGGLGACGRPLCCSSFLSDFGQVSMKMAKEQNLSLNSTKISGCCGRLMCCLRYEHETYAQALRQLPSPGTFVSTPDGPGVVTDVLPLEEAVKVSLRGDTGTVPKKYSKQDISLQQRTAPSEIPPAEDTAEPDSDD